MVVHKLILILSVILISLNALNANIAFDLQNVQESASANENIHHMNNEFGKNIRVEHKRSKRNDDTDQDSYTLNGFLENGIIPVDFPQDICLFELEGILYASVLHFSNHPHSTVNQTTFLTVFKNQGNGEYAEIFKYETKSAIDMDCLSIQGAGFIAISNTIEKELVDLNEGSPLFQVKGNNVNVVQYFSEPFQNKVYLRSHSNNLYFMQSFFNKPNKRNLCPIYKWSTYHFDLIGELTCTNAMQMELFIIESDIYIALANNKNDFDEIQTFSFIYKFNIEHNKFLLHQQIRTHAAVDVKYFQINEENFLVFANSFEKVDNEAIDYETMSVIYKLSNDYFTPFQTILLYDVIQFLPVLGQRNEFILLISCKKQATKAWQYNGWLFYESDVQFTGGALGEGVSNMRTYLLNGSSAVVVANTLMLKETSNIFFPQFVQRKKSHALGEKVEKWCDSNKIDASSITTAENLVSELEKLPMRNIPDKQIVDEINFQEEVTIDTITTKLLSISSMAMDQQTADQINIMNDIIQDLMKRLENIETKMLSTKHDTMADDHKERTVFEYDENVLESEAQVEEPIELDTLTIDNMINIEFINGHAFKDLVFSDRDLNVSEVVVNEVIIKNYENYEEIVGKTNARVKREEMVKSDSENFVVPSTGIVDQLTVNSLIVDGFINRLDISTLNEFALKIRGDQILESEINFEVLHGPSLQTLQTISNRKITDIVQTENGPFTVDQVIQFEKPVFINDLVVKERINNINVVKGNFNILLKSTDHGQVLQAMKTFDAVKLLNPIVLQGKIRKSNLNRINPIVSIIDDIVLEGDYEIKANTTIVRLMQGENIYGAGGVYNVKDLLSDGLLLNTSVIEQIFDFVQPIKVTNLLSNSVNNVDVSKFVQTGEAQNVYGLKNFTGDLHIADGVCDAFIINDIDLSVLNDTVLKRSGEQKIDGKINFNGIRVKRASAKTINLFGHKFADFLTKTDQIIPGNVTIHGNLIVNNIQIENLRTNNKVCEYDLGAIIADTVTTNIESQNAIITGEKFFRNHLTLENAQVGGNVFQLGTMESLLGYLNMLKEDVKLTGPITLPNNLRVEKLTFTQSINGVHSADFGHQWMLSETNQDFIAPQTVFTIKTDEDVILNGTFNNFDLVNYFEATQFKNQPITFKNASFARAIFQQPITLDGLVSGIKFPNDIVLKDAEFLQTLLNNVAVNDINISGGITVDGKVNNVDYNIACDLLSSDASPYGLLIEHDANFAHVPQIEILNGQNVNQLYNEAWLTNSNAQVTGIPTFSQAEFTKPIEVKRLLNGIDVEYMNNHYVSLTKPQEIISEIEVNGNILFQGDIRTGNIHLDGIIKDSKSGDSIKIEEFNQTVFKKDDDQVITEDWYIAEVHVAGELNSLINGFNVVTDVVRYSNAINNVTGVKSFESLTTTNLNCLFGCRLMDVDIKDWMDKVAFLSGNYTIQGTTIMDAPIFYDNLNVFGLVNNLTFTPENVLLKTLQQNINGNVLISNKLVNDNRILPLSFEDVQLESINGKILNEFYLNLVHKDDPLVSVNTRLEFNELLNVDYMQFYAEFNAFNLNELLNQVQLYQVVTNYSEHLHHMGDIGNAIVNELKTKTNYMATYRLQQVIFGNIKNIISVEVVTPIETFDVFVMLNVTDVNGFLNFYIFDREASVLALANSLFGFQPKDMHILDIFSIVINKRDFLVVHTRNHFSGVFGHSFFTHFRGQFRNVYEMHGNISREIVGLNMETDDCFITYSRHATNVAIACAIFPKPGKLGFQQVDELYSSSGIVQVRSVTSPKRVEIIVLDMEGKISVWSLNEEHRFVRSQIIKTLQTTTHITVAHHNGFHYIAACAETMVNSAHLGTIDIYISSAAAYVNIQSIAIEAPTRIELSVVSTTNDLVLYVLTDSVAKPLVIYRYTGITKFKEFTTGVTIPRAQRLNVLKAKVLNKELISLISEGLGGMIIEAKVK